MKLPHILAVSLALAPLLCAENEIGFIEKFALAKDREAVLQQLVPGTEDYYFFHALHFQNSKQPAKLAAILEQWASRFKDSERRKIIENRAALLAYDANPQQTLTFLRDRLQLQFQHVQEVRDQKPNLPAALDPAMIGRAVFLQRALQNNDDLGQFTEETLERLVREKTPLNPAQRRALLSKLTRPDLPGLVELIATELQTPENRQFGEFPIQKALLPEQLEALLKLVPALAENEEFVLLRLRKLAPGADADLEFDPVAREAWLTRAWDYAKTLPAAFPTVKATILRQRLEFDRTRGVINKALFLEYLKLPRRLGYVNPRSLAPQSARPEIDLNRGFTEAALPLPPIGDDETLIRRIFLQLFATEDTWEPYASLVRDTWLKPVFAEAKIVSGTGNPERWASLLTPAAFQALKDRVDIEFPETNVPFLAPSDDVTFGVTIKNTPRLIVKIYELNTLAFFTMQKRPLNTDLNLDGLVANSEQTHDGEASPFRRVTRAFQFPELKGKRGAWIIEFIGGGKSSRALIRKGQLKVLQQSGPAGDLLTVLDETNKLVPTAAVWAEDRRYTAAAPVEGKAVDPRILVPFTAQPGRKQIVVTDADGTFASLAEFEHHGESYVLGAQFHFEREQLLARRQATLGIRAALRLGEAQVALDLLQETRLLITSTTLDDISTTNEVKSPKLSAGGVFTHTITVPERLKRITATLTAKIDLLSKGGEKQDLTASHSWDLNGIDLTSATNDGHLSKFGDSYVFELLGKNGEPLPDQQVVFRLHHYGFTEPLTIALRTDDKGRVTLGGLAEIATVETRSPDDRKGWWRLRDFQRTWPTVLHVKAGEKLEVPWGSTLPAGSFSLLELRGGAFVVDRSNQIAPPTPGVEARAKPMRVATVLIQPLEPGDYSLRLREESGESHTILIRVTAGEQVGDWILAPNRSLQVRDLKPLHITGVQVTDGGLAVKLANGNPFTRVHVAATRFLPRAGLFEGLAGFMRFAPTFGAPDKLPNLFSSGRAIGDEYRYILERRYSTRYPGNLLTRPGLLLNPWETRKTDVEELVQQVGQAAGSTRGARAGSAPAPSVELALEKPFMLTEPDGPNLDFLAAAAPVLWNLHPDENGLVVIPRALLGDRQHVQIYAEDLQNAVWTTATLPELPTKFADLRLARNLDPAKAFTQRKQTTVLTTGAALKIDDLLTSELESYDTLAGVHALFTTLSGDARLTEFAWLLRWPSLKDEEKRAKYSEYASHELSFFLSRKDPAFFQAIVEPYLRNKKDKTFMDEYLLGSDLRRHLEPWRFAGLNAVERALLATRLPAEAANIARHLRELWELLPPNGEEQDRLFETALRGRALDQVPGDSASAPGTAETAVTLGNAFARSKDLAKSMADPAATPHPAAPALARSRMAAGRVSELGLGAADELRAAGKLSKMEESIGGVAGGKDFADRFQKQKGRADLNHPESEVAELRRKLSDADSAGLQINTASEGAYFGSNEAEVQRRRAVQQAFYRRLGPTREWAENNYYKLPISEQGAELVAVNAFWKDFGAWVAAGSKAPFLSPHIAEASRSFTEMMLALAVLDLPFEAPQHTTKTEGNTMTLLAAGPAIIFHQEIRPAKVAEASNAGGLLISESFFRENDRYREEGNERFDKFITGEFLAGVVYGAQVVVTNPNSAPAKLDLLAQIPQGALPVHGSKMTDSRYLRLEPYSTQQLEHSFYFPAPRAQPFPHYPVHVAIGGKTAAAAMPSLFNVVRQLSEIDKTSWDYISQYGTDADVLTFLNQHNIERLDLERVAWRVRNSADFFRRLVVVLEQRHVWSEPIYRYAVQHNELSALREWLRHRDDFLAQLGPWFASKPITVDSIERRAYEHLEYSPLVNQRAHRLGAEHRIANEVLLAQYQRLLEILAHKPVLEPIDEMSVTYYLFLQDRVEEGLARFHAIRAEALPTRIQHDYLRCYAAFYEEKLPEARGVAATYAGYPVDRWRLLFAEVAAQLDEIQGNDPARTAANDREKQQSMLANTQPAFDFKVENRTISLTWKNLPEVTVNYYPMDPEFLFSSSPFVSADPGRFSIIKPSKTTNLTLPAGKDALDVPLPAEFAKANVLVEILAAGQRKAQPFHANTLKLLVAEQYGRLEVRDVGSDRSVSKAYVKVYARLKNGTIRFFKDGYTDLRGRFDYASLNSREAVTPPTPPVPFNPAQAGSGDLNYQMLMPGELDQIARLSLLIMSEARGAATREVGPPHE